MKQKIIYTLFLFTTIFFANGQGTPGDLPDSVKNDSQEISSQKDNDNHVLTFTYLDKFTSHPTQLEIGDASTTIHYFDGLGRPFQTVLVNASPKGFDIVDLQTYDSYGRLEKTYIPYTVNGNKGEVVEEGTFITNQKTFLNNYFPGDKDYGFSQTVYVPSPLNRINMQGSPGADWQPTATNHPLEFEYKTNSSSVDSWLFSENSFSEIDYDPNTLYIKETTDENGHISKEYTDKEGKLIQKEINGLCTHYCYDNFGLLRCVIQPEGVSTGPSSTNNCFYYNYDHRKRIKEKRIPNKGWEYIIYDERDRVVLTQDSVQRIKSTPEWTYTKYDDLNRPTEQGIWATSITRPDLINYIDATLNYVENKGEIAYKKYQYKSYSGGYSEGADFTGLGLTQASDNTGRLTVAETKLLDAGTGMSTWIKATYYYDKYGRIIHTAKNNHLGGMDYITTKYNFNGQEIQTRYRQTVDGTTTYTDTYTDYDHRGRPIKTRLKINNGTEVIQSAIVYDETGQVQKKYLHAVGTGNFLQKNDYEYNIRGWLTKINEPDPTADNDVFGLILSYNTDLPSGAVAQFNGNVAAMKWGTSSYTFDNMLYKFTYDGNNRLTAADFDKSTLSSEAFDCTYSYDDNGNITILNRNRYSAPLYAMQMDELYYYYDGNQLTKVNDYRGDISNEIDYPGNSSGYLFDYDGNGNITEEPNKDALFEYNVVDLPREIDFGINQKVNYYYSYDGEKLRRQVEDNGSIYATDYCGPFVYSTYSGTRSLDYIITAEGRIDKDGSNWDHEYNITDHLGNTRVTIYRDSQGDLVKSQEKHYYPFGLEMDLPCGSAWGTDYLYNGKQLQNSFDLYWYDYGARFYDPQLGRWHSVDPLAEIYNSHSPYGYVRNNPINAFDPNGMYDMFFNGEKVSGSDKKYIQGYYGLPDDSDDGDEDEKDSPWKKTGEGYAKAATISGGGFVAAMDGRDPHNPTQADEDEAGEALMTGVLFFVGEYAYVKVFQGGKWVCQAIKAKTLLKASNIVPRNTLIPTHFITKSKTQMKALLNDIRANGIQETIKYVEHNGIKYIVDGHHRFYAAQKLGIQNIPVQQVNLPYSGYKNTIDLMLEPGKNPGFWKYLK